MMGLRVVAILIGGLAMNGSASADRGGNFATTPDPRAKNEAFRGSVETIPIECRAYAWLPADARDDVLKWNQLLSLATCLQDASVSRVSDPEQLESMVDGYLRALEVPMMIYAGALEFGPGPVRLRALYQLAMAHVTLMMRARGSIVAPADLATHSNPLQRYHELHAQLESLLAPSERTAWLAFAVIDRAVAQDPTLAPDAVTQSMVRSARAMLEVMPEPADEPDRRESAFAALAEAGSQSMRIDAPRRVAPLARHLRDDRP